MRPFVLALLGLQVVLAFQMSPTCIKRAHSSDFEYMMRLNGGGPARKEGRLFISYSLNKTTNALLGMLDIQSAIDHVTLTSNSTFRMHAHPRAAELVYVQNGTVDAVLYVGNEGRVVRNRLRNSGVAFVPQGLPHKLLCVSSEDCHYLSYYNNADPGLFSDLLIIEI